MTPDSYVADFARPSLGYRKGKYEERTRDPVAIVVHTTGFGPVRRYRDPKQRKRHGWADPFDAALTIYERIMSAGPHYVVGQGGQCAQVAPEDVCAWHVGGRKARPYAAADRRDKPEAWAHSDARRYAWWFDRWVPYTNPRQLAGGHLWDAYSKPTGARVALSSLAGSVNANTIGIEVVPPPEGAHEMWSVLCWETLTDLICDIAARYSIPLRREHVLCHSDAHPIARTAANGAPWDTYETQWTWERFCAYAGIPVACGAVA